MPASSSGIIGSRTCATDSGFSLVSSDISRVAALDVDDLCAGELKLEESDLIDPEPVEPEPI